MDDLNDIGSVGDLKDIGSVNDLRDIGSVNDLKDIGSVDDLNDIGYKNPPIHTRFPKGKSGNPKGRPKGSKSLASRVNEVMEKPVQVTENGRTKTIPAIEAILLQHRNAALKGDRQAIREVIRLQQVLEVPEESTEAPVSHQRDEAVKNSVIKRIQQMLKTSNPEIKEETSNEL